MPPLAGGVLASHGFARHVATTWRVPAKQSVVPDTVYPGLHMGWQLVLLTTAEVQVPTPPLMGAVLALHGLARHVAAVRFPAKQLLFPDTVKYPCVSL